MASKSTGSTRVSREEAENKLVSSLIDLLGQRPINEITVDLIANSAGLKSGHVLVHRYFEARSGLVAAAAHTLSQNVLNTLSPELTAMSQKAPADVLALIGGTVELLRRRALLLAELMTTGGESALHSTDTRAILNVMTQAFEAIGLVNRVARATALKVYSLVVMESTHRHWTGTTKDEADDLRNMIVFEIANAGDIAKQMNWN